MSQWRNDLMDSSEHNLRAPATATDHSITVISQRYNKKCQAVYCKGERPGDCDRSLQRGRCRKMSRRRRRGQLLLFSGAASLLGPAVLTSALLSKQSTSYRSHPWQSSYSPQSTASILVSPSLATILDASPRYYSNSNSSDYREEQGDISPRDASHVNVDGSSPPLSSLMTHMDDEEESTYDDDEIDDESQSDSYRPTVPYTRNEEWLEEATRDVLEDKEGLYPLGELTREDVDSIAGLMAAWARRGSVHAALTVERLLKRVVDDMRAGNHDVAQVSTRMYTYAIDAWARSGAMGAARRAQHIHDNMVTSYKQTGDKSIAPTVLSYNHLLNAWAKSKDASAPLKAELILEEMLKAVRVDGREELKPDAVTFSTIMDVYRRSKRRNSSRRCEQLFQMMDELNVKRNTYTFSALQNVYARSGSPDAPQKAKAILDQMLELSEKGDVFAKPNSQNFNAVLHALSKSNSKQSTRLADEMLQKMELPVSEGGYDVEPDRLSYALTILACARCQDSGYGTMLAEKNLEKMELRAKLEAERREVVSSVAPPLVSLDIECFNVALTAISRSRRDDACTRTLAIIRRMEQYAEHGQEGLRPNIRSWNAVLNAFARAPTATGDEIAQKAEEVLDHIFRLYRAGDMNVKPNAFTFAAVLSAFQRSTDHSAAERADSLVRKMEELYEAREIDSPPDVYHYTILCSAWARSRHPIACERCIQILSHMVERDNAGYPDVKPNVRTYNAVLDCLCRSREEERAEQLLFHMLRLSDNGDKTARPDTFSFNSVIYAFSRSRKRGNGRRAESVLERFLEYQEANPSVGPDTRSFTRIIDHYGRSKELDAPYRAEYMLNRMLSVYMSGQKNVEPSIEAFTTVIDSYAYAKHPDAGKNAERILREIRRLKADHPDLSLTIDTKVMNSVLFAWSICGDEDAGRRAEEHLDEMERSCEGGEFSMQPDTKSYELVLSAWSKSSSFDKAKRSLRVLNRMQAQSVKDGRRVRVGEHSYALVINACAFSNSCAETELTAFNISTRLFDEMLQSETLRPTALTIGWFLQACGRLRAPDSVKSPWIELAFSRCCQDGILTDFVLQRLRGAASADLYERLVLSKMRTNRREKGRINVSISDLPRDWSRNNSKSKNVQRTSKPSSS